jgi:ankyrin repeat protein
MDDAAPGSNPLERFLAAVREQRAQDARDLFARHPENAGRELSVDCVLADEAGVAARLAADPGAATRLRGPEDWPPLLYASASPFHAGSPERAQALARIARRLLEAGAPADTYVLWLPDQADSRLPALYFASAGGNAPVTRVLLEHGADPNDGESIYHSAEFDHEECLALLLAHGGNMSDRHMRWGNTPLYFNLGHREGGPNTERADRGIRWLLEHGADPEVTSGPDEETSLHCAARVGRGPRMIALLIAHGAQVSRRTKSGTSPYALALRHGHLATAEALASHGSDTDDVSESDRLFAACAAADEPAARALLARSPGLITALGDEAGAMVGHVSERAEPAPLALLLALGFPAEGSASAGETPLHRAAWHGRPESVALLLARRVRINVRDHVYGCSALAWACHGSANCRTADDDYLRCIDLLIDAGADHDTAINRWGTPPEEMGRPAIAHRLAQRGFARSGSAGPGG